MTASPKPALPKGARRTALLCAAFAAGMLGLAYASVPLYDLFCRVTGYDGTPLSGKAPAGEVLDRTVTVRFDANVAAGLTWRFTPEMPQVQVRLGEATTVFYKVRNEGRAPSTGIATFNVQPGQAGAFFVKMQCFCYTDQTLRPGEEVESAVAFYIDPALAQDPTVRDISGITLSYTYFPSRNGEPVATSSPAGAAPKL
ncbi:MAG TPA: cytochrome c oxidase assembly protein [Beijerinckiaceae bacterium]|jgi:cytochrome c oxidase assembly protein subunit 11